MAAKIFINYRRDDSIGTAGRLHDRLAQTFGRKNLFMDVDHIPAGVDFVNCLNIQVAHCNVFLAIIGPNWLHAKDESGGRRIDNPDDFVAIEIVAALARNIPVVPVLIDGARMPKATELPEALKPFVRRNAVEVRNSQFGRDAEALIAKVQEALKESSAASSPGRIRALAGTAAAAVVLLVGSMAVYWYWLAPVERHRNQADSDDMIWVGRSSPDGFAAVPKIRTESQKMDGQPQVAARQPGGPPPTAHNQKRENIIRYVERYDAGECFFVSPVGIGEASAALEGFGASMRPFEALDRAFQRDQGFEASIGVRQVTQAQCPAITFLNRLRNERALAPRLQIDNVRLRNGEVLGGTVEGFGDSNIELLLVSDDGMVHNVSNLLKAATVGRSFMIGMKREGLAGSQPQLLVAIATPKRLESLRMTGAVDAQQLFPAILAEAERTRQSVGAMARFFKLEN